MHPSLSGGTIGLRGAIDVTEARPSACRHVGLDCGTCVKASAQQVAGLCAHLSQDQQRSMFFRLYPDPVCRHNLARFQRAYDRQVAVEEEDASLLDLDCAVA